MQTRTIEPWRVINGFRALRRDDSEINVPSDVYRYIIEEKLAVLNLWPASFWKITGKGIQYMNDNQQD